MQHISILSDVFSEYFVRYSFIHFNNETNEIYILKHLKDNSRYYFIIINFRKIYVFLLFLYHLYKTFLYNYLVQNTCLIVSLILDNMLQVETFYV